METTKVRTLIKQIRGVSYKPEDLHNELDDNSVILLRANNIDEGKINFDDVVYVDKSKVSDEQYLKDGDILICASSGSKNLVGKAASIRFNMECTFGAFCKLVRPKKDLCEYLGIYFQSPIYRRKMSEVATGANINNIRNEHIDELDIPIFSNDEQAGIVKKMHLIQAIISNRKVELEKLDNLIKARFVEMFGTLNSPSQEFTKATLKELCNKITDGKHGGCKVEKGTERYFIGAREIYDDEVHYDTAPEINVDEFEKDYKRCNIEIGDFLIVNTGATIGKSAITTDERTEHTLLQKSVALLKVKKELLNPVFLKWCYRVNMQMYIVESASAQPNLLLSKINSTVIYVPDIELQNQFADFVHQVNKSKVAVQKLFE
jgi:restriction endonuclease S subunit